MEYKYEKKIKNRRNEILQVRMHQSHGSKDGESWLEKIKLLIIS